MIVTNQISGPKREPYRLRFKTQRHFFLPEKLDNTTFLGAAGDNGERPEDSGQIGRRLQHRTIATPSSTEEGVTDKDPGLWTVVSTQEGSVIRRFPEPAAGALGLKGGAEFSLLSHFSEQS